MVYIIILAIIVLSSVIGLITKRLLVYKFHQLTESNIEMKRPWKSKVITVEFSTIDEIKRFTYKGEIESYTVETSEGNFEMPKTVDAGFVEGIARSNKLLLTEVELYYGGTKVIVGSTAQVMLKKV